MAKNDWDPTSPEGWARALGLVHVPLFGATDRPKYPGSHSVLLDGRKVSFSISVTEDPRELKDTPLSWSWSADLNHSVIVDSKAEEFYVRRWDYPYVKRFRLPTQPRQAHELIQVLEGAIPPRAPDVVSYVLRAFRQVRTALSAYDSIESVSVFLALLTGAETVRNKKTPEGAWTSAGSNRRLEFELGAGFEGACGFALVLALSQMREHGLGPFGRADLHPRRNPLDRHGRSAPQPSKFPLLTLLDAPDVIRLATGNPKSGPALPPGSGGSRETPGATLYLDASPVSG